MTIYRPLTTDEIAIVQQQGCTAADWTTVQVTDAFECSQIRNVHFGGDVRIGSDNATDDKLHIEGVTLCDVTIGRGTAIRCTDACIQHYDIGQNVTIVDIRRMACDADATFAEGLPITILRESGKPNMVLRSGMKDEPTVAGRREKQSEETTGAAFEHSECSENADYSECSENTSRDRRGYIGDGAVIRHTPYITNTRVGANCIVEDAARVCNCTLTAHPEGTPSRIGMGAIVEDSIVSNGSVVDNYAIVRRCFVGECSTLTDAFTATDSLFFVNSFMACGEAVACYCGPFTVSHHKSTLLIGGKFAFFNAGSGTNCSNHAYKMGPLHHGELLRGCKTASNAHLVWPARVGAFTVCMGKIATHPDTTALPFAYLIGQADGTVRCLPGRNVASCGLWRDVQKWERRDRRLPQERRSDVDYNWLNAGIVQQIRQGLDMLRSWKGDTSYRGCIIRGKDIEAGIGYYELLLRLAIGDKHDEHYLGAIDEWADMLMADARKEFALGDVEADMLNNFICEVQKWKASITL